MRIVAGQLWGSILSLSSGAQFFGALLANFSSNPTGLQHAKTLGKHRSQVYTSIAFHVWLVTRQYPLDLRWCYDSPR